MKLDVKLNARRNIAFGILNRVMLMILPFVVRSIINHYLGAEYLGLNSLFSSIFQVLLLSELGLNSAVVYHMYKPVAENDQTAINALLNFYRKAYHVIGIAILLVGMALIPILPHLIRGSYPADINIITVYIIQLVNTSLSYLLFGYRQSLLVAYQRQDIYSIINLVVQTGLQLSQIILLVLTGNYYFYVICMPVMSVINSIWILFDTRKMFPDVRCEGKLPEDVAGNIKKLVVGTFIQKTCTTTRNSLDSICISAFLGLTLTGIYNNYFTIMNSITAMFVIVGASLSGGVGNHVAIRNMEDNFSELKKLDFLYMGIAGWAAACLLCLYQPFMQFWMGESMQLPFRAVILLCIYFYLLKTGDMRGLYSSANGLWWKMRFCSIAEAICNIGLNIGLGLAFGVYGIISATIISLLVCNLLWDASILFSNYFGIQKIKQYYLYHAKYALFTVIVCLLSYGLCSLIENKYLILVVIIRGIICSLVFAGSFLIVYGRNQLFKDSLRMIIR